MTTSDGTESGTPDEPIEIGDSSDVAARAATGSTWAERPSPGVSDGRAAA